MFAVLKSDVKQSRREMTCRRLGPRADVGMLNVHASDRWTHLLQGLEGLPSLHFTFLMRQPSHACRIPESARDSAEQDGTISVAICLAAYAFMESPQIYHGLAGILGKISMHAGNKERVARHTLCR